MNLFSRGKSHFQCAQKSVTDLQVFLRMHWTARTPRDAVLLAAIVIASRVLQLMVHANIMRTGSITCTLTGKPEKPEKVIYLGIIFKQCLSKISMLRPLSSLVNLSNISFSLILSPNIRLYQRITIHQWAHRWHMRYYVLNNKRGGFIRHRIVSV